MDESANDSPTQESSVISAPSQKSEINTSTSPAEMKADVITSPPLDSATLIERTTEVAYMQRGPVPPPDMLRAYEEAVPGSAKTLLAMATSSLAHLQSVQMAQVQHDRAVTDHEYSIMRRGQVCGVVIGVTGLAAGTLIGIFGNGVGASIVAGSLGVGALATLVGAFLYDKHKYESRPPAATPSEQRPPASPAANGNR